MAKFIIEFEDGDDNTLKARIELTGFKGATSKSLDENTLAQNIYFAVNALLVNELGLEVPEVNAVESGA